MRYWISGIILLLCSLAGYAKVSGADSAPISSQDKELLEKAVAMVDEGQSLAALMDFELLAAKYPGDYVVQYERLYCLYQLQRFDDVIKYRKTVLDNKDASDISYQIIGNAYDCTGNRKLAIKTYKDGLKRFPKSGLLNLELGNVALLEEDYDTALKYYNSGIIAQPDFASSYYRAASLYLMSKNMKVWGLVYGESAILLAPKAADRRKDMAQMIVDCLKKSINLSYEGEGMLHVSLVPSGATALSVIDNKAYQTFPGIYEIAIAKQLIETYSKKEEFTCDIPQLISIRKGLVEIYFSDFHNLYGDSMYLLEFQKQVIDAGHWEAYNYYIFGPHFPEEYGTYISTHRREFEAFAKWYNKSPYSLGDGRSVDIGQIYYNYSRQP